MKLILSPVRSDETLILERHGDVLRVNGADFDFAPLPDGATLPRDAIQSPWFTGDVTRVAGCLTLVLMLPHGADAPLETLFPAQITLDGDGPVALPAHGKDAPHDD